MRINEPYHDGERTVQQLAGEADMARRTGTVIADSILPRAIPFVADQLFVVLSSIDVHGDVWASLLLGQRGFMTAEARALTIDRTHTVAQPDDPLWENLARDARVGGLVIDLTNRRRLRINGTVSALDADQLRIAVLESYPNCPKYIQRRHHSGSWSLDAQPARMHSNGIALGFSQQRLIESADTFFVASAHAQGGLDASHRGGQPGFVNVVDEATLRIPDYTGNSMFNTLGNIAAYPQAGLVFYDFQRGRFLQLTGRALIRWDLEDSAGVTGGTGRWWDFSITQWRETEIHAAAQWEFLDFWAQNPQPAQQPHR